MPAQRWKKKEFTPAAIRILERYAWPGNIRELRNAVERLLLLADQEVDEDLASDILPRDRSLPVGGSTPAGPLALRVEWFEREVVLAELEKAKHNVTEQPGLSVWSVAISTRNAPS